MTVALVLGGAACVYDDAKAAEEMFKPDIIVAANQIGVEYPVLDHWATFHPEFMKKWLSARRQRGLPDPKAIWIQKGRRLEVTRVPVYHLLVRGGSSGFMALSAALSCVDKAVLAGVPMDPKVKHFRRPRANGWPDAKLYRAVWEQMKPVLAHRVRSMSGWTQHLFGAPTEEWLRGTLSEGGVSQAD